MMKDFLKVLCFASGKYQAEIGLWSFCCCWNDFPSYWLWTEFSWRQVDREEVRLRRTIGAKKDEYFLDKKHITYVSLNYIWNSIGCRFWILDFAALWTNVALWWMCFLWRAILHIAWVIHLSNVVILTASFISVVFVVHRILWELQIGCHDAGKQKWWIYWRVQAFLGQILTMLCSRERFVLSPVSPLALLFLFTVTIDLWLPFEFFGIQCQFHSLPFRNSVVMTHRNAETLVGWWLQIASLTLMKDHERLDLLKEIGGTRVYEERRKESLKIMVETGKWNHMKAGAFYF